MATLLEIRITLAYLTVAIRYVVDWQIQGTRIADCLDKVWFVYWTLLRQQPALPSSLFLLYNLLHRCTLRNPNVPGIQIGVVMCSKTLTFVGLLVKNLSIAATSA